MLETKKKNGKVIIYGIDGWETAKRVLHRVFSENKHKKWKIIKRKGKIAIQFIINPDTKLDCELPFKHNGTECIFYNKRFILTRASTEKRGK